MKALQVDNGFLIRLEKGEEIISSLTQFCINEKINSGILTGLGAASDLELGFYNLTNKKYAWKKFEEDYEILNLTGNVAIVDASPFIHVHITISDNNFNAMGGHLKQAKAGATCEIFLTNLNTKIFRKFDDEIGLKLLDLE